MLMPCLLSPHMDIQLEVSQRGAPILAGATSAILGWTALLPAGSLGQADAAQACLWSLHATFQHTAAVSQAAASLSGLGCHIALGPTHCDGGFEATGAAVALQ